MGGVVAVGYITAEVFALAVNGTTYSKTDQVLQGQRLAQAAIPDDTHSFAFTPEAVNAAGNVQVVGRELFTTFLLPFEITSLLLLVAAIGAVSMTRRLPGPRPGRLRRPRRWRTCHESAEPRAPVGVG